jgi:SAM-dependent methyltransferase
MNVANSVRRKMHTAAKLYDQFSDAWRRDGAVAAARFCISKAGAIVSEKAKGNRIPGAIVSAQFDQENGVETTGLISMSSLSVDSPNSLYATVYKASDPDRFAEVLARLPIRHQDFSFVDLGSGKGLALLLASHYPFRKVRGLEFAPELHQVAEANIGKYRNPARKCQDVASVCGDAAAFDYPDEPTVIYMYHPFEEELMARVAQQIQWSYELHPRPIILVYFQPVLRRLWESLPCLKPMFEAANEERAGRMVAGYAVFATPEVAGGR